MKESTLTTIKSILEADESVNPNQLRAIERALKSPANKRKLLKIGEVAETLQCCRKTVQRYVQEGKLTPIRYSCRRYRYDAAEVFEFASSGIAI